MESNFKVNNNYGVAYFIETEWKAEKNNTNTCDCKIQFYFS